MKLRYRIILIVFGLLIFLAIAPVLIFFASGITYDSENNQFVRTGALVLKTEPRNATAFLNNSKINATPFTKRFLLPRDYVLKITKEGYFDWEKRVTVHPDRATNPASTADEKIYLLRQDPAKTEFSTTTRPFMNSPLSEPENLVFMSTPTSTALIKQGANETRQVVFSGLPAFSNGHVIVSADSQIFLLLDKTLYQLGETLNEIRANVTYAYWHDEAQILLYGNSNEVWFFRPMSDKPNLLVTRSSAPLGVPVYNKKAGYLFVQSGDEIKAIEANDTSQMVAYTLTRTTATDVPLSVNKAGTELTYQEGEKIYSLKIR